MTKLDKKDFRILLKGLDALRKNVQGKNTKENKKILKHVKEAENALMIIGTY